MSEPKCGTCRFYLSGAKHSEPRGYCRRRAPMPISIDLSKESHWENWSLYERHITVPPIVAYGDWCGEYEERKQ